jgi:hypothetical protein
MATVSRRLPAQPHLDVPKREARELLRALRDSRPEALDRIRRRHPKFAASDSGAIASVKWKLSDAQLVIAREYGFAKWADLKLRIETNPEAHALETAIRADNRDEVVRLLRQNPALLHLPVRSGNWGPPMSHAANLGRLEIVQAAAELGARDFQHAFDRAILQGKIDCARWLHVHGARPEPGIIMGACETLNPAGMRFLAEIDAPFTNADGDRLAPLALVLGTYGRNPAGKHEVLDVFAGNGYSFPDTPMMAFHRGDLARLKDFLRDPALAQRRFLSDEIFPPELGCREAGMCGTPLEGATLLHLAIDYDEQDVFDLLLAQGADVNARATVDANGFGGQTPLFNSVISCAYLNGRQRDAAMTRVLLERGASTKIRASLRKFLDWIEQPRWHEARDVTPAEWGEGFPLPGWVNPEALRLIQGPWVRRQKSP